MCWSLRCQGRRLFFLVVNIIKKMDQYAGQFGKKCDYETWSDWWQCKIGNKEALELSWLQKKVRRLKQMAQLGAGLGASAAKAAVSKTPVGIAYNQVAAQVGAPTTDSLINATKNAVRGNAAYYVAQLADAAEMGDLEASADLAVYYANKSLQCSYMAQMYNATRE
jgi:hypothetical protein